MKKVSLAVLLVLLLMVSVGCRANQSDKTAAQNKAKTVTEVLSPAEIKEAVEKSTTTAKKVDVDLTAIDAQLDSIGDFDIVEEINLD